jgi:hypothetical protein
MIRPRPTRLLTQTDLDGQTEGNVQPRPTDQRARSRSVGLLATLILILSSSGQLVLVESISVSYHDFKMG